MTDSARCVESPHYHNLRQLNFLFLILIIRITLLDISTYPETGQEVLKNFPDNCFDVIFFSSTVEFLPPMEFVDFTKYKETPATGLRNRFSDRAKVTSRIRHNQPTKD
eukprot:TRINITY_DN1576_c0_g1_i6.p1 TRINITY_DN1576_c0_g1~~TRINITY_DN1576_c0_g1_i6.p1  ORF type:complete len:108 (-),score=7.64 TRINITY_DN1576_c0_g1_i6:124-447(-)